MMSEIPESTFLLASRLRQETVIDTKAHLLNTTADPLARNHITTQSSSEGEWVGTAGGSAVRRARFHPRSARLP